MNTEPYKQYQCGTCGFIYDEAEGLPEEGIAPGTRWAEIPDTWNCPDCGMSKSQFEMAEIDA
ncbi:MAG TPA: rubredoxin [Caulobacteraceae bacterium]|nr:rubredoxin [Caulobacteraceae bacterium]